ncbi:MAG: ATP-binding cassette domain-containing protein [Ignavibacteriaceae bacterium]|nr:ATP-binding cassette domain-containing protein [Ignavibacteriaceae bacterium]
MRITGLKYSIDDRVFCDNIGYAFEKGMLYGILCQSEEEASIFLKILAGIYTPDSGTVTIDDLSVHTIDSRIISQLKRKSAFVFERLGLISNLSIQENLLLPYNYVFPEIPLADKLSKIMEYFSYFSIPESLLRERPARLNAQYYKLIIIIRAYIIDPDIIIYDMPFTDLEVGAKKKLIEEITRIREKGETTQVFYSNNDILFDRADRGIILHKGNFVCEGPWEDLIMIEDELVRKIVTNYLSIGLNETEI